MINNAESVLNTHYNSSFCFPAFWKKKLGKGVIAHECATTFPLLTCTFTWNKLRHEQNKENWHFQWTESQMKQRVWCMAPPEESQFPPRQIDSSRANEEWTSPRFTLSRDCDRRKKIVWLLFFFSILRFVTCSRIDNFECCQHSKK